MPRKPKEARRDAGLPSKQEILDYLRTASAKAGKREIARAFGIKGGDRIALKALLAEMAEEGLLAGNRKGFKERGQLPPVAVLEIVARDEDGELIAEPAVWDAGRGRAPARAGAGAARRARLGRARARAGRPHPGAADAARGCRRASATATRPSRSSACRASSAACSASSAPRRAGGGLIDPVDRKELREWPIAPGDEGGAKTGDLVRFELSRTHRLRRARRRAIVETLGNPQDQRKISLIAVHAHGIPDEFPPAVLAEVEKLEPPKLAGRTDLRRARSPHHRSRRCARPRRCRPRRPRHRRRQQRRLGRARGDRRRRPLRAARHPARPRGAAARQLGLLPRPRRADAARADLQRPVLAEGAARSGPASPCAWSSTSTATRRATRSCAP